MLPLIGKLRLGEIDSALVTEMQTVLSLPRCSRCDELQRRENVHAQHEMRPRRHYGNCRSGCGYGLTALVVADTILTLSSVLTRAKKLKYIQKHPLNEDDDFKHRRPSSLRKISQRTPDLIEPIRQVLDPIADLIISILLYEGLRPQEVLALLWRDLINEIGRPHGRMIVTKAIKKVDPLRPGEKPTLHVVEGIEISSSVSALLKTGTAGAPANKVQRYPELWSPVGELAVEAWRAVGCPPLDTFIVVRQTGRYRGFPPPHPCGWMRRHYRDNCLLTGVHYDRNDSAYGLRHIAASMLAIGPRLSTREIAEHLGNAELTCSRVYQHPFGTTGAPEYRGLSMDEVILLARDKAGTSVPAWRSHP